MFTAHAYRSVHNRFPTPSNSPSVEREWSRVAVGPRQRPREDPGRIPYRYQVEVRTSRWTCCLMDDAMRVIRNFHTRAREHRRARRNSGSPLPITDVIPRGVDRGYRTRLTPRMRLLRRPGSRASDPPMSTSVVAPAVPDPARFSTPSPAAPLGTQAASLSDDALSSRSWVVRCWCSSWRCHARARALVRVEGDRLRGLAYRSPRRTKRSTPNRPS